jgi:hypothetical protein
MTSGRWEAVQGIGVIASVLVAGAAAVAAVLSSNAAEETADRLQQIEEQRHLDERLNDLVTTQVSNYYSASCDEKVGMLAPQLTRFFDKRDVPAAEVGRQCHAANASADRPRTFVLHGVEVIASPESRSARALVDLGFYDGTEVHTLAGVASIELVMRLPDNWAEQSGAGVGPVFPITSLKETVVSFEPETEGLSSTRLGRPSLHGLNDAQ